MNRSLWNRGQYMTQTKSWYDCSKDRYKRSKHDSVLHCPYCGKQFTMNGRALDCYAARAKGFIPTTTCYACGEAFFYQNLSAKYCKEHNIKATRKRGENGEAFVL